MMSDPNYINVQSYVFMTLRTFLLQLTFSIPQWMLLSIYTSEHHLYYSLTCFVGCFLLLTAIKVSDRLKQQWPWNRLAIGGCYELITLALGTFAMKYELNIIMKAITMSLLIFAFILWLCFCIIIGYGAIPNPLTIVVISVLSFMLSIVLVLLDSFLNWPHWLDLSVACLMLSGLSNMMFYVLFSFRNLDVLNKNDMQLLGFLLYINYLYVLVASFLAIQRIGPQCFDMFQRPHLIANVLARKVISS